MNDTTPQAVKNLSAQVLAHYQRAEAMLVYSDKAFDDAVAQIDLAPTAPFRFKFEPFTCIFPLAPVDKIIACLAGGGIVFAFIGTKAQWMATALSIRNNVRIVQVTACTATDASVVYYGGETDKILDPAKLILAGAMLWIGG